MGFWDTIRILDTVSNVYENSRKTTSNKKGKKLKLENCKNTEGFTGTKKDIDKDDELSR